MKKIYLLVILLGMTSPLFSQKTEVLTLTGSTSASNGGLIFSNRKGDTIFACPQHPDSCMERGRMVSLFPDSSGGPELKPRFSHAKFKVTYIITDSNLNDNERPGVTATVVKMEAVR